MSQFKDGQEFSLGLFVLYRPSSEGMRESNAVVIYFIEVYFWHDFILVSSVQLNDLICVYIAEWSQ